MNYKYLKTFIKSDIFPLIIFCIVFLLFIAETHGIGIWTLDDVVRDAVVQNGTNFSDIIAIMKEQGRFHHFFHQWALSVPYLADNFFYYKAVVYSGILFTLFSFYLFLRGFFSYRNAFFGIILSVLLFQINSAHNPLTSYPFGLMIPLGFYFLSVHFLLKFPDKNKRMFLFLSSLLLFSSMLLYESFFVMGMIHFVVLLTFSINLKPVNQVNIKWTQLFLRSLPFVFIYLLFLGLYAGWRYMYPSSYDGSRLSFPGILPALRTDMVLSTGMFPLTTQLYKGYRAALDLPLLIYLVFKSALAYFVCYYFLLSQKGKEVSFKIKLLSVFSFVLIFLPSVPHSFTQKYAQWIQKGTYGYISSFYSYFFFIIILLVAILIIANKSNKSRIITCSVLSLFVFFNGVSSNYYIDELTHKTNVGKRVRKVIQSEAFQKIPENSYIYWVPPRYKNRYPLELLVHGYSGKSLNYIESLNNHDFDREFYYIQRFSDMISYIVFKLDSSGYIQQADVINFSKKSWVLTYKTDEDVKVEIPASYESSIIFPEHTKLSLILE